jgi:hypothetical protein
LFEVLFARGRSIEGSPDFGESPRALQNFLALDFGIDFPLDPLQLFLACHLAFEVPLGVVVGFGRRGRDQQHCRDERQCAETIRS